jgi:hypothetical protein
METLPRRSGIPRKVRGAAIALIAAIGAVEAAAQSEAPLPQGVRAVWDLDKALRETTSSRERVCLNGLWRWQPAKDSTESVPDGRWGHFKVPGFWPGSSRYDREETQELHPHPAWKSENLRNTTAAWYQRAFTVPGDWNGRRIALRADAVNSLAVAFVDGRRVGEIRFPAGELDLTAACRPGARHALSLLVIALPLKGVMLSYSDTNAAKEVRGTVDRRGLCGDLWLVGSPQGARVADVRIETSVRKGEIAFDVALEGLDPGASYTLRAEVLENGRRLRECSPRAFKAADLAGGRITLVEKWKPERLWDTHTPANLYDARVSLAGHDDAFPVRFGYREFWIDGRDFYLNGTRLFLSVVPLDNAQLGARAASYDGARETFRRLKSFGVNFVYTHNYGCEPGTHVGFGEILRAADDAGMLVAFSQPHFGQYDWKGGDADRANGYARHAEPYVRAAQNHPSVVAYVMSHNATGYGEDMNPDMMGGAQDPRSDSWSRNNAALALRAEAIVRRLDPGRIVYHHSSGNLGSMHTINFYANFVPVQEMSDWFETWATQGAKPVFPVEYGVPVTWDWAMYRGWYREKREFGSAKVPWEFCTSEWNAQFFGDPAFRISEREKACLRWEAAKFRAGEPWQRWDYPRLAAIDDFEERQAVMALYVAENLRAHRGWGVSAINAAWQYQTFWRLREGADRNRKALKVDWDDLQRPGFSADYVERRSWPTDVDYPAADWIPTVAGEALIRNNRPLLGFIAGGPERFTAKDHNFRPGETVEKQLVVVNNSREAVACEAEWSLGPARGRQVVTVGPGRQERIPVRAEAGTLELAATFRFPGEVQKDSLAIHVLPAPPAFTGAARIALFDPKGESAHLLADLGVRFQKVEAAADLSAFDLLLVGKEALTVDGPAPDVARVRDGLRVIVFEQTAKVMEERFGFRVAEYGLRTLFPRVPGHPALAGLAAEHLRDWRGEATIVPPRLSYTMRPRHGPTVRWCGIEVTRLWRCGNRGSVASVLLEKPARGDFLPILDGGFGLQYSPLLEYREGRGMILFCQLDVTGRTARDPAAERLVSNLLAHAMSWKAPAARKAVYAGDPAGLKHLEAAGIAAVPYASGVLTAESALIVGPGGGRELADARDWVKSGGRVLVLGAEGDALLPFKLELKKGEHIAAFFDPPSPGSLLVGVGPADLHSRDPRDLLLVAGGVLAAAPDAAVVVCQLVPWQFDPGKSMNLKRTFRRASRAVTRLAANLGIVCSAPVIDHFRRPVDPSKAEKRWLEGLYLDAPEEWDDPYRFFRW